jgi:hypothetical protein
MVKCGVVFTRLLLDCPTPTQVGSAQFSLPSPPVEVVIFPLCISPTVLSGGGAICPIAGSDFVVLSREDDVSCSHGGVANSLGWNQIISSMGLAGRSPRYCVHVLGQVQDIPDVCRTSCAVLWFMFLHFRLPW